MPAFPRKPADILGWLAPPLLLLALYWFGLRAWFQLDDFAWLSLHLNVKDPGTFLDTMFRPLAQGTIRPISERLFFLGGWHLFGMEAAPYRVIVFATMMANLWLLRVLTTKLTGSIAAGVIAPFLWIVNGNLYTAMSWTSAYNQVLCATVLIGALLLWIRYTETGDRRYLIAQWVVFLLGFGVLEVNLVYPAIAALHAWCFARPFLKRALAMVPVSVLFVIAHRLAAPPQTTDVYRMYFDASLVESLLTYIAWSVSAHRYASLQDLNPWPFVAAAGLVGIALTAFALRTTLKQNWLPVFCVGWFVAILVPVLPLKNHRSDYYLTIPVVGLVILASYGIAAAGRWRVVALVATLLYALPGAWMAHGMTRFFFDHSTRVKHLVRSVAGVRAQHPDKAVVVTGIDNALFWRAWKGEPFRALGDSSVYLLDGSRIEDLPASAVGRYFIPDSIALQALRGNRAVAYEVLPDGRLTERTLLLRSRLERADLTAPSHIDARDPLYAGQLGEGWWPAEPNQRWMTKRAVVRLRGPLSNPGTLVLNGLITPRQAGATLTVRVDGTALPAQPVRTGPFELRYALPPQSAGKAQLEVAVEIDRTITLPPEERTLGAAFGTFRVVP